MPELRRLGRGRCSGRAHVCDDERRQQFRLAEERGGIDRFDDEFAAWLTTPHGLFAQWLAERGR